MQYTEWLHLHCIHTYLTPKIWTPCQSDYHPMRSGRYDHITTHLHFASTCSLDTDLIVIAGVDVRVLHTKCLSDHLAASEPTHRLTLPITFQNRRSNTHLTQRLLILSTTTTTSFAFSCEQLSAMNVFFAFFLCVFIYDSWVFTPPSSVAVLKHAYKLSGTNYFITETSQWKNVIHVHLCRHNKHYLPNRCCQTKILNICMSVKSETC